FKKQVIYPYFAVRSKKIPPPGKNINRQNTNDVLKNRRLPGLIVRMKPGQTALKKYISFISYLTLILLKSANPLIRRARLSIRFKRFLRIVSSSTIIIVWSK